MGDKIGNGLTPSLDDEAFFPVPNSVEEVGKLAGSQGGGDSCFHENTII